VAEKKKRSITLRRERGKKGRAIRARSLAHRVAKEEEGKRENIAARGRDGIKKKGKKKSLTAVRRREGGGDSNQPRIEGKRKPREKFLNNAPTVGREEEEARFLQGARRRIKKEGACVRPLLEKRDSISY